MRNVEGAKAGSNQKKPYRAPVSVTSTQRMRIKYGISEGTIRGFSAEFSHNEMLKRIYLDGTPIMSAEGEQLLDVVVEFRDGSRDQEPINGLPSISVEHDVGVEVKVAAPVSRSFDRSDTTSYDVRISVPTLYQGDDEGNSNKGLIQFKIDVSTDGGAFEEAGRFEIYEKILNGFAETYNVVVPKGSNHVVRISRLNSEVVSDYSVNRLVVEAITENTDVRLRYTNTAVLYLEYDAEQFSNVPKLEMRVFGKNDILVPANYNGDTHTYATSGAGTTNGVWDGTWKRAYTDNPVWISLDLMISRRYGLGDKIDLTFINKWELYGLAQYCDEAVADGKGGFEPRFTCNNMYLQKSEDAYRVLKDLAASFRAKVVWDGEFITLQADVPRDPVHTFSNANASDITYSSTQDSAQRNLINVQYYDRDNKFASDVVMQRSNSNILSRGKVVDGNFTALGCASQGQAQRIASYVMNTELYETELVSFTTGLEGGLVRLNDVIQMADNSVAGQTVGGRIAAVNGRSITLDRKIPDNVQAIATTQLSINRQDVKNEPISIVSISDDRMTAVLASDAPAGTEAGLVWALLTQDLVPQKFVVTDIEFDSTNMTFAVSAIQYNESKYAAIDGSARIVVPPISVTEYKMLKAPIIVIASYLTRIIQDAVVCDIDVSWAQSTNAVQYQLEMQKAGSDWRIVGRFMSLATTLDNMYTGTYTFRVCAYDSLGNASQYTYSDPILVAGKVLPPPMLAQYNVIGILFGYQHKWIYPAHTEDSRAVRLRFTTIDPVASPSQEWQYIDVAYPTANFTEQDVTANLRTWFSAAIVDKYGNVGAYTAWQSAVPSVDATQVLDLLDGQLTAQQLDQDLTNKIAIGAEAALAAESAQNAADAAAQAATNAQAAADQAQVQVTTTTTELRGLLDVTADGLTQEILDRQNGDANVIGQLDTYKTSNDAAMAAVQQQAEAASSASSANATALTNLNTEVVAAHNLASNALQQAQSATDATSTNASNLIALSSRMDSAVQAGDNLLVNSNVDKPYNGNYPHGVYNLGEAWEAGATYTLLWCASFLRTNWDQMDLVLAAYAGGGSQDVQSISIEGERQVHKVTFVVRPDGTYYNSINFYLLNSNGGYLNAVATIHWAVLVKASDISTKVWVRSKYDVDNAINANAQAIRNTETTIATVDGKVNAQAADILSLNTYLTNLNNTKLDASVINNYYTKVQADQAIAGQITTFESTLALGGGWMDIGREGAQNTIESGAGTIEVIERALNHFKITAMSDGLFSAYIGSCNNSSAIPVGTPYVMTGKIRASRANLYDRIYARFNQYASESYIVGWNASSDWVTFKTSGVTNTQEQYPLYNIIGANIPNATAGDWVEFKDCRIAVNSDSVTAANAQAIRNTETNVATIDGKVTAQATDILNLSTGLTNLNNTKLDAAIIQQYRTAADQDSVTSSALTQFSAALKLGGDNLLTGTKTFNNQNNDLATSTFHPNYAGFGDHWVTDAASLLFGTHTLVQCKSHWRGFYYRHPIDSTENWFAKEDMVVSFWAASMGGVTNVYGIAGGQGYIFSVTTGEFKQYSMFIPKGTAIRTSDNKGIIEFAPIDGATLYYGGVMLQYGSKATAWQPSLLDNEIDTSQFATATALEQTNTNVNNMNGVLTAHTNQLSQQQASINKTVEDITIRDTRNDNYAPSYYRQYFIRRTVREFKRSDVLGLPADYPYFCTLVTTTQWQDASGGAVQQRVEFDESRMNLYRKSNDPTDDWTPWNNTVVGTLNTKADATRVEEINNKVTQTENSIAALSETTTQHTATLGEISKSTLSKQHVLDLSQLDANVYYPIGMYVNTRGTSRILLTRSLGDFPETALPVWATHGAGFTAKCEWTTNGSGWGANTIERTILSVDSLFTANNQPSFGLVAQIGTASLEFIMVRGGAKYYLQTSSLVSDPAILTAPTDYNGTVLQPAPWRGEAIAGNTWSNWDVLTTQSTNASATALEQVKTQVQEINGQVTALSVETNTLSTTVGNNTASIQLQQSSINGLEAKATLQVEAGGTIGGVALGNNGGVVDFLIRSNTFAVAPPAGYGGSNKYLMTYRATPITLPNGTVVSEGLYLNNLVVDYVDASRIYAENLSVITANIGTFVTLKDPTKPNGARMIIQGSLIRVYDDNNVMRVRLGLWDL